MSTGVAPFLRWAGSKRKIIPILKEYWCEEGRTYVEPFMGSACLFFAVLPKQGTLSDINSDLVNTYITIKRDYKILAKYVSELPRGKEAYYEIREKFKTEPDSVKRAGMFIYLNRFCFNGLYRTNKKGEFNVPFGGRKSGQLADYQTLRSVSEALQNIDIACGDFEDVVSKHLNENSFIYLDPPYAVSNKRVLKQYCPSVFGIDDLKRLSRLLKIIDESGAHFLLSYADSSESLQYLSGWTTIRQPVQRNIAGFAKNRKLDSELLITNIS